MARRRQLYEGKAKIIFEGPEPGTVIQYFKDDTTAFNAQKCEILTGKGALNNRISEYLMGRLGEIGIATHFIRRLNMREQLVKSVDIIPIEVVVRNVVAGSLARRLGLEEGTPLPTSITEYYYKKDDLNDPWITEDHIMAFDWATLHELEEIVTTSLRINDYLRGLFAGLGIRLVDFKLEFGRWFDGTQDIILLADEISPDNCRLWDMTTNKKLDKDRFREELGGVTDAYRDIAHRLGLLHDVDLVSDKGA